MNEPLSKINLAQWNTSDTPISEIRPCNYSWSWFLYLDFCIHEYTVNWFANPIIGHVQSVQNVQSCLLIIFQHKPISLQCSWLSVEQPITLDWAFYRHHWEFPIHRKIIPMLTCPKQYSRFHIDFMQSSPFWHKNIMRISITLSKNLCMLNSRALIAH